MHDDDFRKIAEVYLYKKSIKLLLFSILRFIAQTGLYCSKQLETTFHQFCEKLVAYHRICEPNDFAILVW